MSLLVEMSARRLPALLKKVEAQQEDLRSRVEPLRAELRNLGLIRQFSTSDSPAPSVIAVDGSVMEDQAQAGDFMTVAAVSSEGLSGTKSFPTASDAPKLLWQNFYPHERLNNTNIMSVLEMILLEHEGVKDHDIRIIDGSWTSALISVLMAFLRLPADANMINQCLVDLIDQGDIDGSEVVRAINRRMKPWDFADDPGIMIAVAKSDTQTSYQSELVRRGVDASLIRGVRDRDVASLVLQPGEFLTCTPLNTNLSLVQSLGADHEGTTLVPRYLAGYKSLAESNDIERGDAYDAVEQMYIDLAGSGVYSSRNNQNRLVSPALTRITNESWLWGTYFKPTTNHPMSQPIRMDFPRPAEIESSGLREDNSEVDNYAAHVLGELSHDITDYAKEPMSQYLADVEAKNARTAHTNLRAVVADRSTSMSDVAGILNNYRT